MKNILISVIVPVYNVENYLKQTIDSIINQSYKNIEIILVDDGSIDNSGKICDEYSKKDNRIRVIHKVNGGLSDARNAGLKIAKGDYISFVDGDDYIDFNMLMDLIVKIKKYPQIDIFIYGRYIEYENNTKLFKPKEEKIISNVEAFEALTLVDGFDMSVCDKLFKSKIFHKNKFMFGKKHEDYFFTYKVILEANYIMMINKSYYHYVQRQGSISRGKKISLDAIEGSKEEIKYVEKRYPKLLDLAYINLFFAYISLYNISINQKITIEKEMEKNFRINCKKILRVVLKSKKIRIIKKCQGIIFCYFIKIYRIFYKFK